MTRYRPLGTLAFALGAAIAGNVAAPVLLSDLAARQAWVGTLACAVVLTLVFVHRAAPDSSKWVRFFESALTYSTVTDLARLRG